MKVSFIIPFHNEQENVSLMLERVINYARRQKWNFEIIPIDDRSTDNTRKLLQVFQKKYFQIRPVYRKMDTEEKGNTMGKALIEGTNKATGEIVIWTMGDLTDKAETYKEIINKVQKGYDLVFGSRYMIGGSKGNLDTLKAFLSSFGTRLAGILFGIETNDITNAFRGFRRKMYNNLRLNSSSFSISPEFALKAHLAGYKLAEVPTVYTDRVRGATNFKLFKMSKSYLSLYLSLFIKYILFKMPYDFIKRKPR